MTTAAAPPILVDIGTIAGALTAVLVLLAIIGRSKAAHWFARTVFAEPLAEWFHRIVVDPLADRLDANKEQISEMDTRLRIVEHEVTYNDGTSLKDAVRRIERVQAQMVERGDG